MDPRCYTCGVSGYKDLLVVCSHCGIYHSHLYCLEVITKSFPDYWICEECELTNLKKERLKPKPIASLVGSCARNIKKHNRRTVFLSTEEVIALKSGSSDKVEDKYDPISKFPRNKSLAPREVHHRRCSLANKQSRHQEGQMNLVKPCKRVSFSIETTMNGTDRDLIKGRDKAMYEDKQRTRRINYNDAGRRPCNLPKPMRKNYVNQTVPDAPPKGYISLPNLPAKCATWRGSFQIINDAAVSGFCVAINGYPPSKVARKAFEFSKQMPILLQFDVIPRQSRWADLFQDENPHNLDIGIYFLPMEYRSKQIYARIVEHLENQDMIVRSFIYGVELLVFPSKILDEASQKITDYHFLWGIFRRCKDNKSRDWDYDPEMDDDEVLDMEIDMIGGKPIGVIDVPTRRRAEEKVATTTPEEQDGGFLNATAAAPQQPTEGSGIKPFAPFGRVPSDVEQPKTATEEQTGGVHLVPNFVAAATSQELPITKMNNESSEFDVLPPPPGFTVPLGKNGLERVPRTPPGFNQGKSSSSQEQDRSVVSATAVAIPQQQPTAEIKSEPSEVIHLFPPGYIATFGRKGLEGVPNIPPGLEQGKVAPTPEEQVLNATTTAARQQQSVAKIKSEPSDLNNLPTTPEVIAPLGRRGLEGHPSVSPGLKQRKVVPTPEEQVLNATTTAARQQQSVAKIKSEPSDLNNLPTPPEVIAPLGRRGLEGHPSVSPGLTQRKVATPDEQVLNAARQQRLVAKIKSEPSDLDNLPTPPGFIAPLGRRGLEGVPIIPAGFEQEKVPPAPEEHERPVFNAPTVADPQQQSVARIKREPSELDNLPGFTDLLGSKKVDTVPSDLDQANTAAKGQGSGNLNAVAAISQKNEVLDSANLPPPPSFTAPLGLSWIKVELIPKKSM